MECSICFEDFSNETDIIKHCNGKHIFCKKCYEDWRKECNKKNIDTHCPLCKTFLEKKELPSGLMTFYWNESQMKKEEYFILPKTYKRQGLYQMWFPSGKLWKSCYYDNGVIHGESKSWYQNGIIESNLIYHYGKYHGIHTYWNIEGYKESEITYKNDMIEGISRKWYRNGKIMYEHNFKNNLLDGRCISWYSNGNIKYILHYSQNKLSNYCVFKEIYGKTVFECDFDKKYYHEFKDGKIIESTYFQNENKSLFQNKISNILIR